MKKSQVNIGVKDVDKRSWKYLKIMCAIDNVKVPEKLAQVIMEVAKRRGLVELNSIKKEIK